MSMIRIQWSSQVLGKQTEAQVIYPNVGKPPFPVLYLLHGLSDDSTMWTRLTRLEAYAAGLPMAIVMPDGYRGFYTNNEEGPAFALHIGEELPAMIERTFRVRADRTGRAIGGLSMGGYGALRIGLGYPDRFCSIHSHSGALDAGITVARFSAVNPSAYGPNVPEEMKRIFGRPKRGSQHDLVALAKKARRKLPKIHLDCGADDFLLQANRDFVKALRAAKIPHTYVEHPGSHNWEYWDTHIREALQFHAKNLKATA